MNDHPSFMPEKNEREKNAEGRRRNREEVNGHDLPQMIVQERSPRLRERLAMPHHSSASERSRSRACSRSATFKTETGIDDNVPDASALNVLQYSFQRPPVAVNVRDDRHLG